MKVRLAMSGDLEDIVRMAEGQVRDTQADTVFEGDCIRKQFNKYLRTANPTIFVVERDGQVVGFCWATIDGYEYRHGLRVFQRVIYVSPEHRGTRAAVALTRHLIEWAEMLGANEIVGGNAIAFHPEKTRRFLEHFGFQVVGYAMSKPLVPEVMR